MFHSIRWAVKKDGDALLRERLLSRHTTANIGVGVGVLGTARRDSWYFGCFFGRTTEGCPKVAGAASSRREK